MRDGETEKKKVREERGNDAQKGLTRRVRTINRVLITAFIPLLLITAFESGLIKRSLSDLPYHTFSNVLRPLDTSQFQIINR